MHAPPKPELAFDRHHDRRGGKRIPQPPVMANSCWRRPSSGHWHGCRLRQLTSSSCHRRPSPQAIASAPHLKPAPPPLTPNRRHLSPSLAAAPPHIPCLVPLSPCSASRPPWRAVLHVWQCCMAHLQEMEVAISTPSKQAPQTTTSSPMTRQRAAAIGHCKCFYTSSASARSKTAAASPLNK